MEFCFQIEIEKTDRKVRELVVCVTPLSRYEDWQIALAAIELYRLHGASLLVVPIDSVVDELFALFRAYESVGVVRTKRAVELPPQMVSRRASRSPPQHRFFFTVFAARTRRRRPPPLRSVDGGGRAMAEHKARISRVFLRVSSVGTLHFERQFGRDSRAAHNNESRRRVCTPRFAFADRRRV